MGDEITPDPRDFEAIDSEHGRLPVDATDEQIRRHYYLAQMLKMIRLYDHGKLSLDLMRKLDNIREDKK